MADIHVNSVSISPKNINLVIKGNESVEQKFIAIISPENATNKEVLFGFDNTSIGYINREGVLTVDNPGTGTVTVTTVDGQKTDTATVNAIAKKETPPPPTITSLTQTTVDVISASDMLFSIDGGSVWEKGPMLINLNPKTNYKIICKSIADEHHLESDISNATAFRTPEVTPDPSVHGPTSLILSAHKLIFDMNKNIYSTLTYGVSPKETNNGVYWYSEDESVITVDAEGELVAKNVGFTKVYIRSIYNRELYDTCECYVYKISQKPNPPILKQVTTTTIELKPEENCEYSIDKINWQAEPIFTNLNKNSYYSLYQRIKAENEFIPASDPSYALTIKTLNDETPGGESESGYTWGQQVELNNINIYGSPHALKPDMVKSGTYYIFNLIESNHRIRITDNKEFCGVYGCCTGWANIADLKLIENVIYVGDKVVVDGDINTYVDGTGISIHKEKEVMYVTDIISGQEYPYGVTTKPGLARQGFAKTTQIKKYKVINE